MAVYKCKMCGASIEVKEGQSIVTCEFCDTCQTVHSFDNEKKIAYFKRANALRFKNEFDKASGIYETLVAEFPKEAEAYWGLVLCKYGIEYVDDPKTGAKIPTCHRTIFSSIFDDVDYKNAIKYADSVAKDIYVKEAEVIAKLQKEIIEISSKEDPYDIFICYKETDDRGHRTKDSVMAQDIYKVLTNEGYKVFFARVSLADRIGSQYEPIIFSALRSSKVMIHVTTSGDNSESIWVKNEWSRYLNFIKNGEKKALVPVYKDMDVYDLPDEMENFQGINYSKLGAEQDLLTGLEKLFKKGLKVKKTVVVSKEGIDDDADEIYESYMKRGEVFLKGGLFNEANEAFEKASMIYEKSGRAELRKMLINSNCKNFDDFISVTTTQEYTDNPYLKNARLLADEKCNEEIKYLDEHFKNKKNKEDIDYIKTRIKTNGFDSIYAYLQKFNFNNEELKDFKKIIDNKVPEFVEECSDIPDSICLQNIKDIYSLFPDDDKKAEILKLIDSQEQKIKEDTFLNETYNFDDNKKPTIESLIKLCRKYESNEETFIRNKHFFDGHEQEFRKFQESMMEYFEKTGLAIIDYRSSSLGLKSLLVYCERIRSEHARTVARKIRLTMSRTATISPKPVEIDDEEVKIYKMIIPVALVIISIIVVAIVTSCGGFRWR